MNISRKSAPQAQPVRVFFLVLTTLCLLFVSTGNHLLGDDSMSGMFAAGALAALDSKLPVVTGDQHAESLSRGWMHLSEDDRDQAVNDFRDALGSDDEKVRISAYVGLAWCSYVPGKRRSNSLDYLRRALSIDPESSEALYARVLMMLDGEPTNDDVRVAKSALLKLVEHDPGYRNVYGLWREFAMDHTDEEIRRVAGWIEDYLAEHPERAAWRLDLAWDRYLVDGPVAAQAVLADLERINPEFSHPDKVLLEARCKLEATDTLAFQSLYWQAVELAADSKKFDRLIDEAATIFTPEDQQKYEKAAGDGEQQQYLRYFWANVDPDKLNPVNIRLAEHYNRLAFAQRNYRQNQPHNRFNTDKDTNILLGFQDLSIEYHSEKTTFSPGQNMALDHRGLLYMRYGPPDRLNHEKLNYNVKYNQTGIGVSRRLDNPMEIWWYGDTPYVFEKLPMTGEFSFRPPYITGVETYINITNHDQPPVESSKWGDMQTAMTRQRFLPSGIEDSKEYYAAQFAGPEMKGIEVEIYQHEILPEDSAPTVAAAAAYDTLWTEQSRSESEYFRIPGESDNRWVAVHSLSFPPGDVNYAIKFASGEQSWNGRGGMTLPSFDDQVLQLSAIVLGLDPPGLDSPAHERMGVRFIPRPSFRFRKGEKIRVYLEFYNLGTNPESQNHSFREYVDVIRYEGDRNVLGRVTGALVGMLSFGEPKENTQIRHTFDREAPTGSSPVPESFLIDTSELDPGTYRLLVEARDNVRMFWDDEAVMFEIED